MNLNQTKIDWKSRERRKRRVRKLAEEIVDATHPPQAPIDIFALIDSEYPLLKVRGANLGNLFDGQLEYHPGRNRFLLFYNSKYDEATGGDRDSQHPRTRFSIAHELGHYFIDSHREFLLSGGQAHKSKGEFSTSNLVEVEADCFAAGLLTPTKLLSPLINRSELSFSVIEQLAQKFNVSVVSAAISSVQMSDYPCALVALNQGRIKWQSLSPPLLEAGCYPNYGATPKHLPSLWEKVSSGSVGLSERNSSRIDSWFNTYDNYRLGSCYFEETYFSVPVMETLLVLLAADEKDI
ncbi:MAG: ImmA/IrrE family metallo-endopeptidase [Bdellovibrionales bacterium]|nr:ImmA/IrrE family metallo-endopeptidase [Bdellovibrionales bacterium]